MSIREEMAALALSFDGCNAGDELDRYRHLIAPIEPASLANQMTMMSGCALVVRGLLRWMGVQHPILTRPYRVAHAVSDVVQIARDAGAWVLPARDFSRLPCVGDYVLVGGLPDGGGVEHVFTVTGEPHMVGTDVMLGSIDGGQRVKGRQLIAARSRVWRASRGRIWDHAVDVAGASTRVVRGWADISRIIPEAVDG